MNQGVSQDNFDDYNLNEYTSYLDKSLSAMFSKIGYSPAFYLAMLDWMLNINANPGKQLELIKNTYQKIIKLSNVGSFLQFDDKRFKYDGWNTLPFNLYKIGFILIENFYKQAIDIAPGLSEHNKLINNFILQQLLNFLCPINNIFTNPEIIEAIKTSKGENFIQGLKNLQEDWYRKINQLPPAGSEQFIVGKNLAITPGKIIYKNDLIELIQYSPTTSEVYKEPVLIVPACIMKYYILDLSAKNSLVKYLVSEGHTVFMISWKNITEADRNLGFDDYINLGVIGAINVISELIPNSLIHAAGYCLGGTMLAIAASYMKSKSDHRLKSVTLLAAQVDFKLAGELLVFIDENQLSSLKANMDKTGYLDGNQMGSAFNLLHSQDLIWGKIVQDYLLGERKPLFDIMAWNADVTRLPAKMHSEYLEQLFLKNSFTEGEFSVNNQVVSLIDINIPIFAVGTVADHVAPWKSVYKINLLTKTEVTFVLTTGGHNVGIVSEPGHPGRSYQVMLKKAQDNFMHHDLWKKNAPFKDGSWWIEWQSWLATNSTDKVQPPNLGDPNKGYKILGDAPGTYVLKK
jgi:polyhydroxyalkanoate synthase